ncbi:MAG: type IV pilus secretin PilQ [Elusimicrobiales bacterium]|nr:type IV pilus secretin PilQ [Elusimicrobiales bacterium]
MKKTVSILISALLTAQCLPLASAAEAAAVKGVRVSAESVYIRTDRPVKYKSFTVGNPERIIVDLQDARLKTLEDIPAGGTFLRKVRTGQHKSVPVSVARVVLDLTQKAVYDITQKGNEIAVVVGGKLFEPKKKIKDAVTAPSTSVKVITPSPEPAPVPVFKVAAADLKSESVPMLRSAPAARRAPAVQDNRNIMDSLSKEPVSFDYNEADIKEVIAMLAAKAGINVIYGDDISGHVTMRLDKVPFDEAFRTVLSVKGLATQQVGDNILRIASPHTFVAEQKKAMAQTRVFFLNYSRASEVKAQLVSVASAEGRTSAVNVDEANNALIITDTPMGLEAAFRLVRNLDRMPKQVLIEAKLVEVALDNSFHLGINWSAYGHDKGGSYIGSQDDPVTVPPVERLGGSMLMNKAMTADTGGTGVNLPANVIYGAFRLGKVASNYMFDAVISAAAKKGKAKVLSDPKVATLNNKEANIDITTQVPYTTTEVTAATPPISTTKVTYLSVGIKLTVTPTINSDGRISMRINPSVSQISPTIAAVAGGAPGIDTRSADTNVIVRDGETIVIGGLISDTQAESVFKVPLLGDIPILGYLFRKKSVTRDRRELLIFVTPRIIEG